MTVCGEQVRVDLSGAAAAEDINARLLAAGINGVRALTAEEAERVCQALTADYSDE